MEVPPPAGGGFQPSSGSLSSGAPSADPAIAELARRLDAVEAGLGHLGGRLEALAVSLEASFETAVATEVQAAAAELRHSVSELGRILVRDLGKLPQMLTQHRQAIIAELRGTRQLEPARQRAQASHAPPGDGPTGAHGPGPDPGPGPAAQSSEAEAPGPGHPEVDTDTHGEDPDTDPANEGPDNGPGIEPDLDTRAGRGGDRNWRGHLRRHR